MRFTDAPEQLPRCETASCPRGRKASLPCRDDLPLVRRDGIDDRPEVGAHAGLPHAMARVTARVRSARVNGFTS
jgi:hypothetical protein